MGLEGGENGEVTITPGNNALVKKTQSGTLRELIMGSVNRPAAVSAIVSSGVSWQALHKVLHNLGPYGLV